MPPRRAARQEKPLALGFFGVGEVSEKDLRAQLDDLVGKRDVTIYLGLDASTAVATFGDIIDWAKEAKVPVTVFAIEDGLNRNELSWIKAADDVVDGEDVVAQVIERIADAKNVDGRLLLFWDKEEAEKEEPDDGRAFDALEAANEANVPAYNVCDAMDLIQVDPPDEGQPKYDARDDPRDKEPEKEEEKPRRGRTRRSELAPEPEEAPARRGRGRRAAAEPEEASAAEDEKPARSRRGRRAPADEAQADAREQVLDKLQEGREKDEARQRAAVNGAQDGDVDFAKAVMYIADLVADRVITKLQAAADE